MFIFGIWCIEWICENVVLMVVVFFVDEKVDFDVLVECIGVCGDWYNLEYMLYVNC